MNVSKLSFLAVTNRTELWGESVPWRSVDGAIHYVQSQLRIFR